MPNPFSHDEIRGALERVLASDEFARNERQSQFLQFLIERHLDGREHELKESVLAVEVFGRKAGYDPKVDAIVRTEAIRLRARLEKYYKGAGSIDRLVIELPKGGYRPVFRDGLTRPEGPPGHEATVAGEREMVPRPTVQPSSARPWWMAAAGILLSVAAAAAWWGTTSRTDDVTFAVLPFENLSRDPGTDYFPDGLTEEVIRNLSVIDGVTVRSRTSSFALKGKDVTAVDAGRQLNARYLVEGSVLLTGDQLRVNVALVDAGDGSRLWSERYDRTLTDVFSIQDEISRGIVNTLRLRVSGRRQYEANLEAYDLYLRGRQVMAGFPARDRPIAPRAIEYFERAIQKDPNYAIAYAGLADAFLAVDRNMGSANTIDAWTRAKAAAHRALELDPMLSEAHAAVAGIRAREYDWPGAERGFRRAIALNSNNALAHLELGARVLLVTGRVRDGLDAVARAVTLDPLSPYVMTEAGEALLLGDRPAQAIEHLRRALVLDPARNRPYNLIARALYSQGRIADAEAALAERDRRSSPQALIDWLPCLALRSGDPERARALVDDMRDRPPRAQVRAHACLGDDDDALLALEAAVAANESGLPALLRSTELSLLRAHPRFVAVQKQLHLAP